MAEVEGPTINLIGCSRTSGKWYNSILRTRKSVGSNPNNEEGRKTYMWKVSMISQGVKTRAGTPDVAWSRSFPCVLASDIDKLILVECGERKPSWTSLSFLMTYFCLVGVALQMPFHESRISQGLFSIWAKT